MNQNIYVKLWKSPSGQNSEVQALPNQELDLLKKKATLGIGPNMSSKTSWVAEDTNLFDNS